MIKSCETCDYGSKNEIGDVVCVNSASANCCEFMSDDDHCPHWQNYQQEFEQAINFCIKSLNVQFRDLIKGVNNGYHK